MNMKKARKNLAVLLAVFMLLPVFGTVSFAADKSELQFNEDGKFTILNVSDIQCGYPNHPPVMKLLRDTVRTVKPDLVVMTGDNIAGYACHTKALSKACLDEIMNVFAREKVPVAIVFGNHDDEETTATKEDQMRWYERFDCFVGEAGPDDITGVGTYNLPILSSDGSHYAFNIWMTDSGTYNDENDLGGYGCPHKDRIEWYKRTALEFKAQNGGQVVPSINFQHIIPTEIRDLILYPAGGPPVFKDGVAYEGEINEPVCPAAYTNGQFDAFLEIGDVIATVSGHDHTNTFKVNYKGVDIVNTPSINYITNNSDHHGDHNGSRVFVIDENDPTNYETRIVTYFDVYGDGETAENYFQMTACHSDAKAKFIAFFKYIRSVLLDLFGLSGIC